MFTTKQKQIEFVRIPEVLLNCKEAPGNPGKEITQADVAIWAINTREAYEDCKSKLEAIKEQASNLSN